MIGSHCHECGQRDLPAGITFRQIITDFFSYSFSIEGPFIQTLRMLLVNPGVLFREFIGGRRKAYYKPIQLFLVITIGYLFLVEITGYNPMNSVQTRHVNPEAEQAITVSKEAGAFMFRNINNFLFFLAFSLAFALKLFHWRRQTYSEFLVIGFYVSSIYILMGYIDPFLAMAGIYLKTTRFLFLAAYIIYTYLSFLGGFTVWALLRGILISFITIVVYVLSAWGVSLGFVLMGLG